MAALRRLPRFALLLLSLVFLILGLLAGLMRLDLQWSSAAAAFAVYHGPLMICGFLGTLISLERAVALGRRWAYAAPLITAAGAVALITGISSKAAILAIALGSFVLVVIFIEVLRKQLSFHHITMSIGAVAWLAGNVLWLRGDAIPQIVQWWIGFLVLTIAGERLELNRLLAPSRYVKSAFGFGMGLFLVGMAWVSFTPREGHRIAGLGMIVLALWLARFDVARFTVRKPGLPRFVALCLFCGYAWLGVGGLVWILGVPIDAAGSLSFFMYDAMLHSIFLGFVFSMIFAHAPIVFPAVTGRVLPFRRAFYAHVVVLHLSLIVRITSDLVGSRSVLQWAGVANVVALVLFITNSAYSMATGRGERKPQRESPAGSPAV